jgi:hypothetical protein
MSINNYQGLPSRIGREAVDKFTDYNIPPHIADRLAVQVEVARL